MSWASKDKAGLWGEVKLFYTPQKGYKKCQIVKKLYKKMKRLLNKYNK